MNLRAFSINVHKADLASGSYTLKATLTTPDLSYSWKIDGTDLASEAEREIVQAELYDTNHTHTLVVSGAARGLEPLSHDIRFVVIAN